MEKPTLKLITLTLPRMKRKDKIYKKAHQLHLILFCAWLFLNHFPLKTVLLHFFLHQIQGLSRTRFLNCKDVIYYIGSK